MSVRRVLALGAFVALAGLGGGVTSPRPASASTSVSLPASIDATAGTDVSTALEQFLVGVAPGTTVEFPNNGRFRVDGVLRLNGLRNVTIDGNGSTVIVPTDGAGGTPPGPRYRAHWPRLREHVAIRDSDTLVVRDLIVRGPNADGKYHSELEGQAGFSVTASAHVTLEGISASHTYGDGVYVAGKSTDVTVRNGNFTAIGRQGVAIVNASNVLVEGNRLDGIARSAIDVEPAVPQWSVTGLHIQHNEIGDFGNFALAAGGAGAGVDDLWFQDNHVMGGNGLAIFAGGPKRLRHGLHIIGNRAEVAGRAVTGTGRSGVIQLARTDGVEVSSNDAPITSGTPAVTLDGVCNLVMRDNHFPGASSDQEVVTPCGGTAPATKKPAAIAKKPAPKSPSRTAGAAGALHPADNSTNSTWLIVGGALGLAMVGVLLGILVGRRRPTT